MGSAAAPPGRLGHRRSTSAAASRARACRFPASSARGIREDFAELVPRAEDLIRAFTGLEVAGFRSRAWVMARSEWIRAEPQRAAAAARAARRAHARRSDPRAPSSSARRWARRPAPCSATSSRKVLGQYDVFLPPDDEGLLYFVGPNVVEVERRFSLPPKDFRLWIAIHEVTHRVQFGSATWLRGYLAGQVDEYLGSIQLDSGQMMEQLKRAADGGTVRRRLARDGRRVPAALRPSSARCSCGCRR